MPEIILEFKLGGKIISSKQKVKYCGHSVEVPFIMKKRTIYTLIFTNTDYKKGIPVYSLWDIKQRKLPTPDWWKKKPYKELTEEENKELKEAMEKLFLELK